MSCRNLSAPMLFQMVDLSALVPTDHKPRSAPRLSVPSRWVDRARKALSRASSFGARYLLDLILTHSETLLMPQLPSIQKLEDSTGSA